MEPTCTATVPGFFMNHCSLYVLEDATALGLKLVSIEDVAPTAGGPGGLGSLGGEYAAATAAEVKTARTMRGPADRNPVPLNPMPQSSCSPLTASLSHTSMGAGPVGWYRCTKPEVVELGAVDHMNTASRPPGGISTPLSAIEAEPPAGITPEPTVAHTPPMGCWEGDTMSPKSVAFEVATDIVAGAVPLTPALLPTWYSCMEVTWMV